MMKKLVLTLGLLIAGITGSYGQSAVPDSITYSNNIILLFDLVDIPPAANNIKQIKEKQFERDKVTNEILLNYTLTGALSDAHVSFAPLYNGGDKIDIKLSRDKNGQWLKQHRIGDEIVSNTTYQADEQGRIVSSTIVDLLAGEEQQTVMVYGINNRLHSIENRDPDIRTTAYGYGENGQISSIINGDTVIIFTYDEQNRLIGSAYKYMSDDSKTELSPIISYSNFDSYGNWQSAASHLNADKKYTREITYQ